MNIEQFSKEHLSVVLDALIKVKNGEIEEDYSGICYNADCISTKVNEEFGAYEVVEAFSIGWPKHSGNVVTPCGYKSGNKWIGEQGALRYELLDFLIDELTKVVDGFDD